MRQPCFSLCLLLPKQDRLGFSACRHELPVSACNLTLRGIGDACQAPMLQQVCAAKRTALELAPESRGALTPQRLRSVGEHYACFAQTTDDEVVALLRGEIGAGF